MRPIPVGRFNTYALAHPLRFIALTLVTLIVVLSPIAWLVARFTS